MSSSSVCQGLQSCLEPWLMEPLVQKLKLTPPKSKFSPSISSNSLFHENDTTPTTTIFKSNDDDDDEDTGGTWSFLQCLTNTTKETDSGNEKVYVHPLVKRSSPALSEKSLEMCTESLGSETGSSLVSYNSDDEIVNAITSTGIDCYNSTEMKQSNLLKKRTNRSLNSFPPPLTSISSSKSVQVMKPHREGGRLVLQAVTVSSSPAYFQAERSDGRLRLCLVKHLDPSPNEDDDDDQPEDEEEEKEEEEEEEEEEFDEEAYDEEDCYEDCEDFEGENEKEFGIEDLQRPSRCNEDRRGSGNRVLWEPFLVAT